MYAKSEFVCSWTILELESERREGKKKSNQKIKKSLKLYLLVFIGIIKLTKLPLPANNMLVRIPTTTAITNHRNHRGLLL